MSDFKELLDDYEGAVLARSACYSDPNRAGRDAARAALEKCYEELNTHLLRQKYRYDDDIARLERTIRQHEQVIRQHQEYIVNLERDQDDKPKTSGVTRGT